MDPTQHIPARDLRRKPSGHDGTNLMRRRVRVLCWCWCWYDDIEPRIDAEITYASYRTLVFVCKHPAASERHVSFPALSNHVCWSDQISSAQRRAVQSQSQSQSDYHRTVP